MVNGGRTGVFIMGKGNGHVIANTPIVVDLWTLQNIPSKCARFLTHMHADHIQGLTKQFPHRIYCTSITAKLLNHKFGFGKKQLVELEYEEAATIYVEGGGGVQTSFVVTAYDAMHCPGSAMFLFEGSFGTILYSGDFRYEGCSLGKSFLYPFMRGRKEIDILYLDNTYNDPACYFPSRLEATDVVIATAQEFLDKHDGGRIVIGVDKLGKEPLLIKLAQTLMCWIGVTSERLKWLSICSMPNLFTNDLDNVKISALPNSMINEKSIEGWNEERACLVILPTARHTGPGGVPHKSSSSMVHVVPYSDHSSFQELLQFVQLVAPKKIIPIVQYKGETSPRNNMACFKNLLNPLPLPLALRNPVLGESHPTAHRGAAKQVPLKRRSLTSWSSESSHKRKKIVSGVQYTSPDKLLMPSTGSHGNHPIQQALTPSHRPAHVSICDLQGRFESDQLKGDTFDDVVTTAAPIDGPITITETIFLNKTVTNVDKEGRRNIITRKLPDSILSSHPTSPPATLRDIWRRDCKYDCVPAKSPNKEEEPSLKETTRDKKPLRSPLSEVFLIRNQEATSCQSKKSLLIRDQEATNCQSKKSLLKRDQEATSCQFKKALLIRDQDTTSCQSKKSLLIRDQEATSCLLSRRPEVSSVHGNTLKTRACPNKEKGLGDPSSMKWLDAPPNSLYDELIKEVNIRLKRHRIERGILKG